MSSFSESISNSVILEVDSICASPLHRGFRESRSYSHPNKLSPKKGKKQGSHSAHFRDDYVHPGVVSQVFNNYSNNILVVAPSKTMLCEKLIRDLQSLSARAIGSRGIFTIGLSGGSLPGFISGLASVTEIEWDKWHIFLCDERCVSESDPASTIKALRSSFLKNVNIPKENIHSMQQDVSPDDAAAQYECQLRSVFGEDVLFPRFDAVMLGCGPDGHTASLFPGHSLLDEKTKWVASIFDSPKLPAQRITLTLPVLQAARVVIFVVTGEEKAKVVRSVFTTEHGNVLKSNEQTLLPCTMVKPSSGQLVWYVDDSASSLCSVDVMDCAVSVHGTLW